MRSWEMAQFRKLADSALAGIMALVSQWDAMPVFGKHGKHGDGHVKHVWRVCPAKILSQVGSFVLVSAAALAGL